MRKLPIGIQDFAIVREGGHIYVDKTALIHRLISGHQGAYFLSRPRRFGKSLLCSTLEAIFEARRYLFQEIAGFTALAIDSLDWEWKKYPVITLLLNSGEYTNGDKDLRSSLHQMLKEESRIKGVELRGKSIKDQFKFLIKDLYEKFNEKVVVIIDEYDKPLLDTIDKPQKHNAMRDTLKSFYGALKSENKYLRMAFITGITKFSQIAIFSDLNHLTDITFDPTYSEICGLTQDEVEQNFNPEINCVLKETGKLREVYIDELRAFYNGFRFNEKKSTMYNPFGLLQHFYFKGKFSPYWYDSGSPSFLIKLIKDQKIDILDLKNKRVSEQAFNKFDIENMDALPLLYQTGYLTISDHDKESNEFILDYPNLEVSSSFAGSLLELINPSKSGFITISNISGMLIRGEIDDTLKTIKQFLATTPYDLIKNTENYYHTAIHIIFTMLGIDCRSEVRIAGGRIDTLVQTKKFIYLFEFKLDQSAEKALEQIDAKEYMLSFINTGKRLFKIGVNFKSEKRNIDEWIIKEETG